jgi:hypothetical protein
MRLPPRLHPLHVELTPKVILVARLLQPPPLAGGFARLPARRFAAIPLPRSIPRVDFEELPAVLALARTSWMHRPASRRPALPSTSTLRSTPQFQFTWGRKTTHGRRNHLFATGRKSTEEKVDSYPPENDEFLLAADSLVPPLARPRLSPT